MPSELCCAQYGEQVAECIGMDTLERMHSVGRNHLVVFVYVFVCASARETSVLF